MGLSSKIRIVRKTQYLQRTAKGCLLSACCGLTHPKTHMASQVMVQATAIKQKTVKTMMLVKRLAIEGKNSI